MQFHIENTSSIRKASINLNGLTVIGGENDTGKSTVGKLLFAIVKGISRFEQDLSVGKEQNITRLIENLYFSIRRITKVNEDIRDAFYPPKFTRELKVFSNSFSIILINKELDDLFLTKETIIHNMDISNNEKESLIEKLLAIKEELLHEEDKSETIKKALSQAFFSEFYAEISPKNNPSKSRLHLEEASNKIFEIEIENNAIERFDLYDEFFFNDVTFVETAMVLQLHDIINTAQTLFDYIDDKNNINYSSSKVSLHLKDLVAKIKTAEYYAPNLFNLFSSNSIINTISQTIGGEFSFEKEQSDFKYLTNRNEAIRPVNTASGIKSFGLIQLLLKANILNNRSLLILDEPETHLHPKWQIEYAKLIIELVENDISILVTSHSPYMIQALNTFSKKNNIQHNTSFYLAEKNLETNSAEIVDVSKDLNRLFQKLSEPLQELLWK